MDWGRAKTILILSFFMLNLLLGYQLWYDQVSPAAGNADAVEAALETEEILAARNIALKVKVPSDTPKLRDLTVMITPIQGEPRTVKLLAPFSVAELDDKAGMSESLSQQIPDVESYRLDPMLSSNESYVLHQMYGDYPMFDVTLELLAQDGMAHSFRQSHAEVMNQHMMREQKVLSGIRAVGILAENRLEPGTSIIDVQLGYHGQAFNSETRALAPYWRIVTDRGEQYFIHAITGEE